MLTRQELEQSPLFENISYEEYRRMLTCFQAAQRAFRRTEAGRCWDRGAGRGGADPH